MYAALVHLGFKVTRVAGRVLMGSEYREGMALDHSFLLVKIDGAGTYMCDPGMASATPKILFDFLAFQAILENFDKDRQTLLHAFVCNIFMVFLWFLP